MAKTLYDYWFVQFDFPDENGKPYKSSGNKMVWNEVLKRDIPIGWELKTIGDYCKSRGGFAFKSSWWTTFGESVIKIKDIQENSTLNLSVWITAYFLLKNNSKLLWMEAQDKANLINNVCSM